MNTHFDYSYQNNHYSCQGRCENDFSSNFFSCEKTANYLRQISNFNTFCRIWIDPFKRLDNLYPNSCSPRLSSTKIDNKDYCYCRGEQASRATARKKIVIKSFISTYLSSFGSILIPFSYSLARSPIIFSY